MSDTRNPPARHTPLPWALSYGFNLTRIDRSATYVAPAAAEQVGIKLATPWTEGAWDDDEEAEANAEFIVRACNSYYELTEALAEQLEQCLDPMCVMCARHDAILRRARGEG